MTSHSSVLGMFATRVSTDPDAVAVSDGDQAYSYRQLADRSDVVAKQLRIQGIETGDLVGLCAPRGFSMIVGILGIMKAGAAYVPLDPAYPDERLALLVADCATKLVLTIEPLVERLPRLPGVRLLDLATLTSAPRPCVLPSLAPDDAAYVIYTSGSTGTPKGVVVEHGNVVRLFTQTAHWFHFGPDDVWSMFHSFGFDVSVFELWGALAYGGRLVIVPASVTRSPKEFHQLLARERVTVLSQTPSFFRQLSRTEELAGSASTLGALRYIIFAGEALDPASLRGWIARHGDAQPQLINMYGITETTVHSTFRRVVTADCEKPGLSPIGVPIPDLSIYLLDADGRAVSDGDVGEIYLSGPGVTRGYLHRPELTAARFTQDPFSNEPGRRMYRSGDLARRRPDGELEYLGRADAQLKVRGFRIEPGEVENCLRSDPALADVAVIGVDRGEGDKALLAYIVLADQSRDHSAVVKELRALAKSALPEHMRPAAYELADALPLNTNGKLDRNALRERAQRLAGAGLDAASSGNPLELKLLEIWRSTLGRTDVGLNDNFFKAGGTSLGAVRLLLAVHEQLGAELDMSVWSEHSTVAGFASLLHERGFDQQDQTSGQV